jgi:flavin reductase (DIM6/NTAB) family NADH-FMN oxidoreductase RutF
MLWPLPAVMITSKGKGIEDKANILTLSWVGTINSDPPMLSISVRPERYSYDIIDSTGEFVVNIPSISQARATDYCGCVSGRNTDKWEATGLTQGKSQKVACPTIAECPVSLECKVKNRMKLGSHVMFIAEVVNVQVDEALMNETDRFALERSGMFAYIHGHYYAIGKKLGRFGFAVRKKPVRQGARSAARPSAKFAARALVNPAVESDMKPFSKPAARSTARPSVKFAARGAFANSTVEPTAKPFSKPTARSTARPSVKFAPRGAFANSAVEPTAKPFSKPAARSTARPSVKPATGASANPKPPVRSSTKPPVKSTARPVTKRKSD